MSVYNPQINQSFLEQLEIMSTDIRQQKKDIAAAKLAAQTAQGTALTAQGTATNAITIGQAAQQAADAVSTAVQTVVGTVETLSVEMVRKFTSQPIEAAAFVLDAVRGYYYATVSHGLGDAAPDIEVYDADKDKQRMQSLIVDNNTIELELDAEDLASNSFPLTCIVLGKNTPSPVGVGLAGEPIPGRNDVVRYNANSLNGTVEYGDGNTWSTIDGLQPVLTAYLGTDAFVHVEMKDGTFQVITPGTWNYVPSSAAAYAAATDVSMGAVLLGTGSAN